MIVFSLCFDSNTPSFFDTTDVKLAVATCINTIGSQVESIMSTYNPLGTIRDSIILMYHNHDGKVYYKTLPTPDGETTDNYKDSILYQMEHEV